MSPVQQLEVLIEEAQDGLFLCQRLKEIATEIDLGQLTASTISLVTLIDIMNEFRDVIQGPNETSN